MSDQPHPYARHPAAGVLADHIAAWRAQPTVLDQAGLLADGTPPETPTERVLAERADRRSE